MPAAILAPRGAGMQRCEVHTHLVVAIREDEDFSDGSKSESAACGRTPPWKMNDSRDASQSGKSKAQPCGAWFTDLSCACDPQQPRYVIAAVSIEPLVRLGARRKVEDEENPVAGTRRIISHQHAARSPHI